MQNTVYERKRNSEDFILLHFVTNICFGNRMANVLVTEQPQYSVVICAFSIWQNTETMLISNVLRFIFTCPLSLALPITFHTSRHTFATMMLTLGADLYTTSKLLGHADVKMTQVYAKIINQKKDDAVNLVNGLFD
mgnify:CR=1 FL=1